MIVGELLGPDHSMHVRLHELLNQIHFVEGLVVSRFLDVKDADNVLVVEVTEQLHFSQGTQAEHAMIERGDLLDGDLLARGLVEGRTVRAVSVRGVQEC